MTSFFMGGEPDGSAATLEIQAKRTLSFTPGDTIFEDVVRQIVKPVAADFNAPRLFAVATARSSRKIDGPYQAVLQWARDLDDAESFFARLRQDWRCQRRYAQFRRYVS